MTWWLLKAEAFQLATLWENAAVTQRSLKQEQKLHACFLGGIGLENQTSNKRAM